MYSVFCLILFHWSSLVVLSRPGYMADDRKTAFWMLSDQVHLSPKGKESTLDKKFCSPTFSVHLTHKPVVPRCVSFHRLCCQNLWEATRKSQPIVAMWNPRAGATPSCIWWRAFLGILESSQLLTVLLNLPTVDNFHFLLLDSEDKLLRYSCNRSNRPLRSDCGMLWAKLTKLESPPAACHPISPMKSTVAMSPCKECRIPTWPIAVLNYDLPVIMLPPKCRQFRTKACWVPVCFTQQPGCTDVSCKVPRFSPPTSDRPPKGFNASVADSKVYFNVVSTHQNWYEMQLHKIYEWAPAHWSSWSIIVNGSCSLSLSLTHALPWFLTWL